MSGQGPPPIRLRAGVPSTDHGVPTMNWFILVLLVLTAYRLTRLVVRDTFPPVLWVRDRLAGGTRKPTRAEMYHDSYPHDLEPGVSHLAPGLPGVWYVVDGQVQVHRTKVSWSPHWLAELITCPWCASAYVSGAVVAVTDLVHGLSLPWLTAFAVWAGSSLLASRDWA